MVVWSFPVAPCGRSRRHSSADDAFAFLIEALQFVKDHCVVSLPSSSARQVKSSSAFTGIATAEIGATASAAAFKRVLQLEVLFKNKFAIEVNSACQACDSYGRPTTQP